MRTLVVGAAIVDQMMLLDRLPKSGEDVLCKGSRTVVGGCAFNVANTLHNLECDHDLCVSVGNGMYADVVRKSLAMKGYPILLENKDRDNGYCLSLIEADGERTFITVRGAEDDFRREWLDSIDMSKYDFVYAAGYQLCGKNGKVLAGWLTGLKNKTVFFDPGPVVTEIDKETMDKITSIHPVLHINEKEALDFTGEKQAEIAAKKLFAKTGNTVIITLGSKGTDYFEGNEVHFVPSEKVKVVDTVGAGDSHIGAVIGELSKGKDIESAVRVANIVAAGIVGVQGPTMSKEAFYQKIGENINE